MTPRSTYVLALGIALALVPAAMAAKKPPPKPGANAVNLDAKPSTIVFSKPTTLSGRLTGANHGGVVVRLEADSTRPYGDKYQRTDMAATTAANGNYSLVAKPTVNTQYRAVAQASPPVTSNARLVLVRTLVGLKVSTSTPRAGSRVRFSGSVFPAHTGRPALIQKRSPSGRWGTVRRTTLRAAGSASSTYSARVRVARSGVYRAKVPGDSDHVNGFSRTRTITVR